MEKIPDTKLIISATNELIGEATTLLSIFDSISSNICKMEKDLNNSKAYFPYKYQVSKEQDKFLRKLEDRHKEPNNYSIKYRWEVDAYYIEKYWYLSWEADESSKNFRLFLIAIEKEIVIIQEYRDRDYEFKTEIVFKKPLIETPLNVRLQYSGYLIPFISSFEKFLKENRLFIESGISKEEREAQEKLDQLFDDIPRKKAETCKEQKIIAFDDGLPF